MKKKPPPPKKNKLQWAARWPCASLCWPCLPAVVLSLSTGQRLWALDFRGMEVAWRFLGTNRALPQAQRTLDRPAAWTDSILTRNYLCSNPVDPTLGRPRPVRSTSRSIGVRFQLSFGYRNAWRRCMPTHRTTRISAAKGDHAPNLSTGRVTLGSAWLLAEFSLKMVAIGGGPWHGNTDTFLTRYLRV